jgi:hypothetical protein
VSLLLSPLTHFLYSRPPSDGGSNRTIEDQYQSLHNIIAVAAYLSICVRLSPTIIYFSHVTPNTPYDNNDHHSVDAVTYTTSKQAVVKAFKETERVFDEKEKELEGEIAKLKAAGKGESRACKKAQAQLDAHVEAEPDEPEETHQALTKIAVWPSICRYKPGTKEDDDAATPLENRLGCRIFDISRSGVVCYFGVQNRVKRFQERVALQDFVDAKVKLHGKKESGVGKGVALAAVAAAAASLPYLLYGWTGGA